MALASAIVNINVTAKVVHIVKSGVANPAPEGVSREGRGQVGNISGIFECSITRLEKNTLLWIHGFGFAPGDAKKFVVKEKWILEKVAIPRFEDAILPLLRPLSIKFAAAEISDIEP